MDITAPVAGRIADLNVEPGARVAAGETVAILEAMKMEHPVTVPGLVTVVKVSVGDAVDAGDLLATLDPSEPEPDELVDEETPDLAAFDEVMERHEATLDAARPEAVAARHERGRRTVRENLDDLCDDFVEYGPLALAAQQSRRDLDDLIRNTPADGMVGGGRPYRHRHRR